MSARALLALVTLAAACTAERRVLENPDGVVTTCDAVWSGDSKGAPCSFAGRCERATPGDEACCTDVATCVGDVVALEQICSTSCDCHDDSACTFGAQLCEGRCVDCPSTDVCAPCPAGWVPLARNGCPTCQCGPPPRCDAPGELCDPTTADLCYAGASCADGCDASVPGCCSNACAERGCPEPVPLGCVTACPPGLGCALCATTSCTCSGGAWSCDAVCVESLTVGCTFP